MNLAGRQISHYRIIEKLGSGGMGVVYKAEDLKLKRFVALKFLSKDLISDVESQDRFTNEAIAISKLDHPNIATIYEIDETGDSIFISMAYYAGASLADYIASKGRLGIDEICSIGIQVADGLREAHAAGIIHRDVKPANIMVLENGQVKILDFGLAKILDQTAITKHDTVIGTAAYMAPEQVQGGVVDHQADIFSFGIVIYEMLTGERPFKGEYSASVAYAIVNEDPPAIQELRPDTPAPFVKVIEKALAKNKEERYQEIEEIKADLKSIQDGYGKPSNSPQIVQSRPGLSKRPYLIAGVGFVLVVVIFAWILRLGENAPTQTSITVMPLSFEGAQEEAAWEWLSEAISEFLNTNLAKDPRIRILDGSKRIEIMRRLGIQSKKVNLEQALTIARKAHSTHMMLGSLQKADETITVQARIYGTAEGHLLREFTPVKSHQSNPYQVAIELADQLTDVIHISSERPDRTPSKETASLDIYRYFLEGRDAAFDQRYSESIEKLQSVIRLDSTFVRAYRWLAYAYAQTGNRTNAKRILKKGQKYVLKLSEEDRLEYLCEEAKLENRWKDYAAYLEQLLRIDPEDAITHHRYGWTQYYKFRQIDAGIAAMQKSLQFDSTYGVAYNDLGYAYLAKGDREKALQMIEKYIALNPADINPLDSKAEILLYTGQYEHIPEICERVLAMQPDFLLTRTILARVYMAQGKYKRALEVVDQYMDFAKSCHYTSIGQTSKSEIKFLQGEFKKALEIIDDAIEMDTTNVLAHWMRGRILLQLNDHESVKTEMTALERVLLKQGGLDGRWLLYHLRGEMALRNQSFNTAVESFRNAITFAPFDRSFYFVALANAYDRFGQFQDALKHFNSALEFNPNNAFAAFGKAQTFEKLKAFPEAKQAYENVLTIWSKADPEIGLLRITKEKILDGK